MKQRLLLTFAMLMTVCTFCVAQGKEAYAVLSDEGKTLTFYYDTNKSTYGANAYELNTEYNYPGWYKDWTDGENPNKITKVVFDSSFEDARPTSTSCWFAHQEQLTEITDIEYLNTSQVTNMHEMFNCCMVLKYVELSGFDTQNVEDMSSMFNSCYSLTRIDLSRFKTSKVTNMDYLFYNCSRITNLNVSNFDTSSVTDMYCMFSGCSNLTSLNLSNFKTDKVTDSMAHMFGGCSKLVTLDLTSFNTSNVSEMDWMFNGCTELKTIYVGDQWNIKSSVLGYSMFNGCINLEGENGTKYDESHTGKGYAHIDGGTGNPGYLSARPSGYAEYKDGVLTFYNDGKKDQKTGETYLLPIETDGYPSWSDVDESVQKVVFDTSFATSRPVTTYSWFDYFSNLTEIVGLEYLNTCRVTNMANMFYECNKLTSLDVSHFNTSKVTDMSNLFEGCFILTSLDVSSWDTSNVTDMMSMFGSCYNLATLNLSNWDTSNVTSTVYMFYNCRNLTTIYASEKWNMDKVTEFSSNHMFQNCEKLVGGAGTAYNFDPSSLSPQYNQDKTFAHIDGGESDPGYFTYKKPSGITTGMALPQDQVQGAKFQVSSEGWYTIDGRKLNSQPTKKGVYIRNGKVVMK